MTPIRQKRINLTPSVWMLATEHKYENCETTWLLSLVQDRSGVRTTNFLGVCFEEELPLFVERNFFRHLLGLEAE